MYGVSSMNIVEDVALVSFHKIPFNMETIADIFQQFAQHNINIDMISQTLPVGGNVSISFTCLDKDMVAVLALSKSLQEKFPQFRPMVSSGNVIIQLTGPEMRHTSGVFARVVAALAATGTELQQISTSEIEIDLLLGPGQVAPAAQAIAEAFALN